MLKRAYKESLLSDDSGQGLTEVALIISLIIIVAVATLSYLGNPVVTGLYDKIVTTIETYI